MGLEIELENYLSRLDKALGPISVSERSDIVTEIKSHVLEARDREPERSLRDILSSLGEPETVANRYLLERGLKPGKPPKAPIVKWLTIGFLGTLGMLLLFIMALIWNFSPLVKIDGEDERITLLGGMIKIDGKEESVSINGKVSVKGVKRKGKQNLEELKVKSLYIPFVNGKFKFATTKGENFSWSCKSLGEFSDQTKEGVLTLDLSETSGAKCSFKVPVGVSLKIKGGNGKVDFERPNFPIDLELSNGKIHFEKDSTLTYDIRAKVVNGKLTGLDETTSDGDIPVKLTITNGKVSVE